MRTARNRTRWLAFAVGVVTVVGLTGCADYLNHRDTVTLAAGDAMQWNQAVHTIDPWPPQSNRTQIDSDGARHVKVVQDYQNPSSK